MFSKVHWRNGVLTTLALASGGFIAWTASVEVDRSAALAGIAGMVIGAGSLAVSVVQPLQAPAEPTVPAAQAAAALGDDVRRQWLGEAGARAVGDDAILPAAWTIELSEVADIDQSAPPWQESGGGLLDGAMAFASDIKALALPDGTTDRIVIADGYDVELWTARR